MIVSLRKKVFGILKAILVSNGFAVIKWKPQPPRIVGSIKDEADQYLVAENPVLLQIINKYKLQDANLTNSDVWNWIDGGLGSKVLKSFRGDRAYVWQLKGVDIPELRYLTSTYFQMANDELRLLHKFVDDSLFGNYLIEVAGRHISRDILDSANEINFLERHLRLSAIGELRVLDIGAGYGRLAHRFSEAFPNLHQYYCTDGVPVSAFICDYYLKFRGVPNAEVVLMPDLKKTLEGSQIQLAVNVHSFSECSLSSIEWWINTIADLKVRYLMIVPNAFDDLGASLLTNKREDFSGILTKYKYKLMAKEPKYGDPLMQKLGLYPSHYYLFEREVAQDHEIGNLNL